MDYGKFKYEASVRAREARKKQTRTVIKEVQFRPKIGQSDFEVKRKRVVRFLSEGDKVKVTMRFRGREVTHPEIGRDILRRLTESVENLGVVETPPRLDGRQMTLVLAPLPRSERMKYAASQAAAKAETAEEAADDVDLRDDAAERAAAAERTAAAEADAEAIDARETTEAIEASEAFEELEAAEAVEAVEAVEETEAADAVKAIETIEAGNPGQEPATE